MPQGIHFASRTDALFHVRADPAGGVRLIPRAHMRAAIERTGLKFRDAAPMSNLGRNGKPGFLPGDWPKKQAQDADPGTRTGSQGSSAGAPRRLPRSPTPSALKRGAFTVSDQTPLTGTAMQYANPSPHMMDEEPDETEGLGETVAQLPAPEAGCIYRLEEMDDGSVAVVHCPDDGDGMTTADRTYRHKIGDHRDALLVRMNRVNIARNTRDWASEIPRTIFRYPATKRNARLTLEPNIQDQSWDLVLWTIADPDRYGKTTTPQRDRPGTVWPATSWNGQVPSAGAPPGERSILELPTATADHGLTAPQRLRLMQAANTAFWAKRT